MTAEQRTFHPYAERIADTVLRRSPRRNVHVIDLGQDNRVIRVVSTTVPHPQIDKAEIGVVVEQYMSLTAEAKAALSKNPKTVVDSSSTDEITIGVGVVSKPNANVVFGEIENRGVNIVARPDGSVEFPSSGSYSPDLSGRPRERAELVGVLRRGLRSRSPRPFRVPVK